VIEGVNDGVRSGLLSFERYDRAEMGEALMSEGSQGSSSLASRRGETLYRRIS